MPFLEGIITVVQESRFQMTDDAGASHLFVLGPHAAADPAELAPLAAREARVRVDYREGENVIAAVVRRLYLVDPSGRRP